jgi:hypothetical protein
MFSFSVFHNPFSREIETKTIFPIIHLPILRFIIIIVVIDSRVYMYYIQIAFALILIQKNVYQNDLEKFLLHFEQSLMEFFKLLLLYRTRIT